MDGIKKNLLLLISRDYRYKLTRKPDFFSYQRSTVKKGVLVRDVMTSNSKLKRYLDENPFILSDSLTDIYSNSLNSVMYFSSYQDR